MNPISQMYDADYLSDIKDLQEEYSKLDRKDKVALRAWLDKYSYLANHDLARIANVSLCTIYKWRIKAGYPRKFVKMKYTPLKVREVPPAPADWRQTDWLKNVLTGADGNRPYTMKDASRATGMNYWTLKDMVERKKIPHLSLKESRKSAHPCCNRQWLMKHYCVKGKTIQDLAKLAGVARLTMSNWLQNHGIRLRDSRERSIPHGALDKQTD